VLVFVLLALTMGVGHSAQRSGVPGVMLTEPPRGGLDLLGPKPATGGAVGVRDPEYSRSHTLAYEAASDADAASRGRRIYEVSKAMYRDLDYYIKVVDRNGEPVSGVSVTLTSRGFSYAGSVVTGRTEHVATFRTDHNGLAHLRASDVSFYVKLGKDGYAFESFGDELNDRDKPTSVPGTLPKPRIIHAYRLPDARNGALGRPEYKRFIYRFVPDGRAIPISLDGRRPRKGVPPDLLVRLKRRLSPAPRRDEFLAWEASIEAPDGGIAEAQDPVVVEAPETGYIANWSIANTLGDSRTRKTNRVTRHFYVKARGGRLFAHLSVMFDPIDGSKTGQAYVDISETINMTPNSRYLYREY